MSVASYFARRFFQPAYFPRGYWPDTGVDLPRDPVFLPTSADAVLAAVVRMLVDGGVVPAPNVAVSLTPEPFPGPSGTIVVLCPGAFSPRAGHQEGMGRDLTTLDGSFTANVIDLSAKDPGQRDLKRLTAASGNVLASAAGVLRVLQEQFVTTIEGDHLSLEPVLSRGQGQPRKYGGSTAYAGVELAFSLAYVAKMA